MLDVEFFDGLAPGLALESLLDINWMEYSISLPQLTMCFGYSMRSEKFIDWFACVHHHTLWGQTSVRLRIFRSNSQHTVCQ